ncbi:gastrula zinc finger -like, partial [Paramuricea clavata]
KRVAHKHKRTHSSDNCDNECDICKKRFTRKSSLTYHKKHHLLCNTCSREIVQPQDLNEQFFVFEHNRKYSCSKCDKLCVNFTKLVRHISREHGSDGNYQCGSCQELKSTEPTGVGYVCCVCDVVFDIPGQLEDHMASHDTISAHN